MTAPTPIPFFPGWATHWRQDSGLSDLLDAVEVLRSRRAKGNRKLPEVKPEPVSLQAMKALKRLAVADDPAATVDRQAELLRQVRPLAEGGRWPRWIYLERALEMASRTGDLLLAAIVLRTMAEELCILCPLDRYDQALGSDGAPVTTADADRLQAHIRWLAAYVLLPEAGEATALMAGGGDNPRSEPADGALVEARQLLNDYVHPNYGSHRVALFPELAAAGKALLLATRTIYEAFFGLSWSETRPSGRLDSLPPLTVSDWASERRYLPTVMTRLRTHRQERGWPEERHEPAHHVSQWLDQGAFGPSPDGIEGEVRDAVSSLAMAFDLETDHDTLCSLPQIRPDLGLPGRQPDWFLLIGARRLDRSMERRFPLGVPARTDEVAWLDFMTTAIELAVGLNTVKINAFQAALIRQVNDGNPLGAALCMRSLLEHDAIGGFLALRVAVKWQALRKRSTGGSLPEHDLEEFEGLLAEFLAGTKGTQEDVAAWKAVWPTVEGVNLQTAVQKGFAHSQEAQDLYGFSSALLHGRLGRGIELAPPGGGPFVLSILSKAMLVLDELCEPMAIMQRYGTLLAVHQGLDALSHGLDANPEAAENVVRRVARVDGKLKAGRDYRGKGTVDDPIVFQAGLPYHESMHRYCHEQDIDLDTRSLATAGGGQFHDVVLQGGQPLHFRVPKPDAL